MKVSKLDLAYMAGIVDGEGTITITRNNDSWRIRLSIGNTDKRLLEWVQKLFGGSVCEGIKSPPWKNDWKWQVSCQKALSIIGKIYPFLILKKEQAELAIEFQSRINRTCRGKKVTVEEIDRRNQLLKKIQTLNCKGVLIASQART